MNNKFMNPLGVLLTAIVIGVTAGCATVQTAFAPGMVVEAKSASGANSSNSGLVPGSVDPGVPNRNAQSSDAGAPVHGSEDLMAPESAGASSQDGALIPGSIDLRSSPQSSSTFRQSPSAPWSRGLLVPR